MNLNRIFSDQLEHLLMSRRGHHFGNLFFRLFDFSYVWIGTVREIELERGEKPHSGMLEDQIRGEHATGEGGRVEGQLVRCEYAKKSRLYKIYRLTQIKKIKIF